MEIIVLQEFIQNQFIIIESDDDFGKLQKVVEELKKKWQKDRKKVLSATLVSLDPDVPSNNPIITEVENVIIDKWPTFLSYYAKTKDSPIPCIRAVILEILSQLAEANISFAALIWHSGINVFRFYKLGREEKVLRQFMSRIGNKVERTANDNWKSIASLNVPEFKPLVSEAAKKDGLLVGEETLENHLKAASIYTHWGRGGENPHAHTNGSYSWPEWFSERAAQGIAETLNEVLENHQDKLAEIQKQLNQYFTNLKPYFEDITVSFQKSSYTLSLKNHLLWWKESLYSETLQKSYRDMDVIVAVVCMAHDLSKDIPDIYPTSVDYFLKESLNEVIKEKASLPITFSEFVNRIQEHEDLITSIISVDSSSLGRRTLLQLLKGGLDSENDVAHIGETTGIDANKTITYMDLTIWLLHDFKAHKISTSK